MIYNPDGEEFFYEPELTDILRNYKESADIAYSDAKFENLGEDIVDEKLAEIKKSHLLIETAHHFLCAIDDELAKGKESALRIDRHATKNFKFPYITIASLVKWASETHQIEIFKSPITTFADFKRSQQSIEEFLSGQEHSLNLHIIFALLIEAFARKYDDYRHPNEDTPKVQPIAKYLAEIAENKAKAMITKAKSDARLQTQDQPKPKPPTSCPVKVTAPSEISLTRRSKSKMTHSNALN